MERPSIEERLAALCHELGQSTISTAVRHRFADDVAVQGIDSLDSLLFDPPIDSSRRALEVKRLFIAGQAGNADLERERASLLMLEQQLPALLSAKRAELLEQCVGVFYASTRVYFAKGVLSERERLLLKWDVATLLLESAERAVHEPLTDKLQVFKEALRQFAASGLACVRAALVSEPFDAARLCAHAFVEHHQHRAQLMLLAEQLASSFCPVRRGDNSLPVDARLRFAEGSKGMTWLEAWLRRERAGSGDHRPSLRRDGSVVIIASTR